jgi:hypothetical protein
LNLAMKLPTFFVVGTRPVKAVPTPDGGMDVLAFDWQTGELVREMGYLERLLCGAGELDVVDEAEFERRVAELRSRRGRSA